MRNQSTYRGHRRNAWRNAPVRKPWAQSNAEYGDAFDIGGREKTKRGFPIVRARLRTITRSKYMPHESVKRGGAGPVFAGRR
jgi:hypothetical protein